MNLSALSTFIAKLKPLVAYLLPVALISPSFIWIALDKSVWTWDQAWYGKGSVELFYVLVNTPSHWISQILNVLGAQAPGVSWFGQFFVPLGYLVNSFDTALLLSILFTQAFTLILMYQSILELSRQDQLVAVTSSLIIASAPLFVGLSHQYFAEPLQLLAVTWFVLIMSFAPKWSRAFILSQLLLVVPVAILAKVTSPLYCLGPGLVALWYIFRPGPAIFVKSEWLKKPVLVTLVIAIVLNLAAASWYYQNFTHIFQHVSVASSGPIAEVYGKKDIFFNTLLYWLEAVQNSFFLPGILLITSLVFGFGLFGYLMKPKTSTKHFTLCSVTAILQIFIVLNVFSLSSNRETRYLLPLLPYCALVFCWSLVQINRPILTGLAVLLFAIQLATTYSQAFGIIPRIPTTSRWLVSINYDQKEALILEAIASRTCTKIGSQPYWNIIGIEQPWLNQNSAGYFAAKSLAPRNLLGCYYGTAYSFFEFDPDKIWNGILATQIRYYITINPDVNPVSSDPHIQAVNRNYLPILKKVQASNLFELEPPLPEAPDILIFRRKETNPQLTFGHVATLLDHDLTGELRPTGARVHITLEWQALQLITQPYALNLRVVASDGSILAEQEFQRTTDKLEAGDIITNRVEIEVPASSSQLLSSNLEIRLLDAARQTVPLQSGAEALIIPQAQHQIDWRVLTQRN